MCETKLPLQGSRGTFPCSVQKADLAASAALLLAAVSACWASAAAPSACARRSEAVASGRRGKGVVPAARLARFSASRSWSCRVCTSAFKPASSACMQLR